LLFSEPSPLRGTKELVSTEKDKGEAASPINNSLRDLFYAERKLL
jgi:hypothetical protein